MKAYIVFFIALFLMLGMVSAEPLAEQNKKTRSRIDIAYFNTAVNERYLTIKVTTRVDNRHRAVPNADIDIYLDSISPTSKLGRISMSIDGTGTFVLPASFFKAVDTLSEFTFICTLKDHPEVEDRESELLIKDIELKTEYIDQDSLRWIRAIVFEKNGRGSFTALEDVDVSFFVARPFRILPISDPVTTDEEGKATIQFPDDLPGDVTGHVTAIVKIDDSDDFGTVEKRETIQWGVPTVLSDDTAKRSLWAAGANAPIVLLILTNLLIAVTWGIIFYIVYKINYISKL